MGSSNQQEETVDVCVEPSSNNQYMKSVLAIIPKTYFNLKKKL